MEIRKIAVLGAGLMGHGIAQVAAQTAKCEVNLRDVKQEFLDNGINMIKNSLQRFLRKEAITEAEANEILARIHPMLDLKEAVADADLIIEAVPERVEIKKSVFAEADKFAKPEAMIVSNTSSISITELAAATNRQKRFAACTFSIHPN
jgi:enoyl-CoA hydratase/3-hydroxyacyl-CoA dehydrogenase